MEFEYVQNKEFENVCDRFADNKLSVHFGEDKTKCIPPVGIRTYLSLT